MAEKEANIGLPFIRVSTAYVVGAISETIDLLYDLNCADKAEIIKIKNNLLAILMVIYADEAEYMGSQLDQNEAAEEDSTIH
jgi:hypothetical protein